MALPTGAAIDVVGFSATSREGIVEADQVLARWLPDTLPDLSKRPDAG